MMPRLLESDDTVATPEKCPARITVVDNPHISVRGTYCAKS
ncbi:hypothetical protein [Desulfopila inferna]|nr:hypothetical protein [Desulfopila inferna]